MMGFDPPSAEVQTSTECEFDAYTLQATTAGCKTPLKYPKTESKDTKAYKMIHKSGQKWPKVSGPWGRRPWRHLAMKCNFLFQHAFRLLVTKERPEEVSFQHFEGLLTAYKPRASK